MTTQLEGPAMRLSPTSTRRWFEVAVVSFSALQMFSCGLFRSEAENEQDELLVKVEQGISCGVERWAVKTGTDLDVGSVNMTPQDSAIATLVGFARPGSLPPNHRVSQELQVYRLTDITLTIYKLESDSDYHLVLSDGGQTMIAEIPHPSCVGAPSPFLPGIQAARATFDGRYTATTFFQMANVTATVIGAGFFDFFHGQTGVAPNAFELHAVLGICFEAGCQIPGTDDFSIEIIPDAQTLPAPGSVDYAIVTAVTSGNPQPLSLDVSDLPDGVTAVFDPASINSGDSSTLTLTATGDATLGTVAFTVTGTGPSASHSTSAMVTVTMDASRAGSRP